MQFDSSEMLLEQTIRKKGSNNMLVVYTDTVFLGSNWLFLMYSCIKVGV